MSWRVEELEIGVGFEASSGCCFEMHKTACQLVGIDSNFADLVESLQQRNSRLERAGLRSLHLL